MNVNSISTGNVIIYNGKYCLVTKREHVKPGKGGAFLQVEMKDLKSGNKLMNRFNTTDDVEKVNMEDKPYQYQYMDGENLSLMDMESYEQILLSKELVGDALPFLQEGMDVVVEYCDGNPLRIRLPEKVVMAIQSTEATVKGQTAAASYKPAILENGVRVMVPPFITSDDKIIVRTEDATYVERAK
ncbi:MAG TPA: elongation factor P [Rickettsiales bacterium]|nr:elongation factor P [Rickettsiales bacterium]